MAAAQALFRKWLEMDVGLDLKQEQGDHEP